MSRVKSGFRETLSKLSWRRLKKIQPGKIHYGRFRIVSLSFYGLFIVLGVRAIIIQLFPGEGAILETIAENQYQTSIDLAPYRGTIFDRREIPLAISIRTPSIAVNPRIFRPTSKEVQELSKLLKLPVSLLQKISTKTSYFAWLRRKIPHKTAQAIASMHVKGLHEFVEPARFYPNGTMAANLIGAVGLDNRGLFGLEAYYDSTLRGRENKIMHAKDARGNSIFFNSSDALPEKSGNNMYLTIDQAIQEITEEALAKAVKKAGARGGFALVSDPHTGRILAMANVPTFDPNNTSRLKIADTKNQAIGNLFEPGSIMKPFVISRAVESGSTAVSTVHNCEKSGRFKIDSKNWIHDDHPKEFLTTGEVLVHSSNICTVKIAQKMGPREVFRAYKDFGFAPLHTILGILGESRGRLDAWEGWRPIRLATIAFGQGSMVSGLEIIRAYGAIANGGNLVDPYVLERVETEKHEIIKAPRQIRNSQIISPETARQMRHVLAEVVTSGTGKTAATDSFTTGGKTGTAQKVDSATRAYSKTKRTASFAGFAPVEDPHIVVFVVVDEPVKTPYYGSLWAAPAFSEIVDRTLKYLNVAHDKTGPTISGAGIDETGSKKI
jgi:cell division protein FtsI (penicillin-binding protein 3)